MYGHTNTHTHTHAQTRTNTASTYFMVNVLSPEVEPDIIGVFCVCAPRNNEMKWGARGRKGPLWQ